MIENVETYACKEQGCGRRFENRNLLLEHIKRRHPLINNEKININKNPSIDVKDNFNYNFKSKDKSKLICDELFKKIDNFEKDFSFFEDNETNEINEIEEKEYNHKQNDSNISYNQEIIDLETETNLIKSNPEVENKSEQIDLTTSVSLTKQNPSKVNEITDQMIGIGSKYADYEEVDEINLEGKGLICFRDKRSVNFTYLLYVSTLNLSNNFIKDLSHISNLNTVRFLNINNNRVGDLVPLEALEFLESLQAENNEISSIVSLNKCKSLKTLHLANNKINYETSTYNTLKYLNKIKDLTIKNNPFIREVIGFRHLFINKYPNLKSLDKEEISEIDREIAVHFLENNSVYAKEPVQEETTAEKDINYKETSVTSDNILMNSESVNTNISNNASITNNLLPPQQQKTKSVVKESKTLNLNSKSNHPLLKNNLKNNSNSNPQKEIDELRNENKFLAEKNKIYEKEVSSLISELEILRNLNKEYEILIEDFKRKENQRQEDDEKSKLRKEVEIWKREYCDLLDKSVSTNVTESRVLNNTSDKSRPQTTKPKRKNSLDDSIERIDKIEKVASDFEDDDEEIEEMLRKSVTNLEALKSTLKVINKAEIRNDTITELKSANSKSNLKLVKPNISLKNKIPDKNK